MRTSTIWIKHGCLQWRCYCKKSYRNEALGLHHQWVMGWCLQDFDCTDFWHFSIQPQSLGLPLVCLCSIDISWNLWKLDPVTKLNKWTPKTPAGVIVYFTKLTPSHHTHTQPPGPTPTTFQSDHWSNLALSKLLYCNYPSWIIMC